MKINLTVYVKFENFVNTYIRCINSGVNFQKMKSLWPPSQFLYLSLHLQFNLTEVLLLLKLILTLFSLFIFFQVWFKEKGLVNFVAIDSVSVNPFFLLRKLQAVVDLFRNHWGPLGVRFSGYPLEIGNSSSDGELHSEISKRGNFLNLICCKRVWIVLTLMLHKPWVFWCTQQFSFELNFWAGQGRPSKAFKRAQP